MLLSRVRTLLLVVMIVGLTSVGVGLLATQPWADAHPQDPPAAPAGDDAAAKRMTKLLRERRDAAEVTFTFRMKKIEVGASVADNAFFASALRLHESELDFCRTRAERIKACELHLKRMSKVDAVAQLQVQAGKIFYQADGALATYFRLDAEIRLEHAKSGTK